MKNNNAWILLTLLLFTTTVFSQDEIQPDSVKIPSVTVNEGSWVVFKNDSLFKVLDKIGPYNHIERADLIQDHLNEIYKRIHSVEDSFNFVEEDNHTVILYGQTPIMSVTNGDVSGIEDQRQQAAITYAGIIKSSFEKHLERKSIMFWAKNIGMMLLLLAGLIITFVIINKVFKWIDTKLTNYEKGLKRKRKSLFRYLAPKGPDYFFLFLSKLLKWFTFIVIFFLYFPLIFRYNVYTEDLVRRFYEFISVPVLYILNGIYHFIIHNLIYIVIILLITRYLTRVMTIIAKEIEQEKLVLKGFHSDWARPTVNILKVIIYVFALVFMFPYIPGSSSPAFQGVSIFLGVLLSLGSTSAISNAVAGIVITYMRPFSVGDRVRIGNTIGEVTSKTMLVTKIKTLKNEDVTIPNATIINGHLWNYSTHASELGVILHTSVTIGYDVPWEQVNELLLKAAKNTPNLTREFKPFVLQKSLDDFYVEYELNVYTKQPQKMPQFYSDLHKNILEVFNEAGVEILSPHYNAIRNGNDTTITEIPDTRNPIEKVIDKAKGKE